MSERPKAEGGIKIGSANRTICDIIASYDFSYDAYKFI